ncbi:hypothetical protein VKT23_005889 [Stygiomarasmius scandens]|uniref:Gag protein n=1 Tax=Marasmiellus scandens TaxID=2682957 RepID=A0ABR1JPF2_9AGAR
MSYEPYQSNVSLEDFDNWAAAISEGVDFRNLGFDPSNPNPLVAFERLFRNAHTITSANVKHYVDQHVAGLTQKINEEYTSLDEITDNFETRISTMENELTTLGQLVATQGELLQSYKAQLDKIPAEAGGSGKITKYSEPPTFSGSDNKMTLEDWLNHVALYCSSTGIVTDHQKIVCGLTRLRAPATTYMKWYFDATRRNEDLGSWDKFVKELTAIYGRRDETQGAKDELTALWANKTLASKDFIKYAEQYRTLARIVEYEDKLHVDKLSDVIPQELRNSLVMVKVAGKLPEKWDDFLELLLETYKALHPEKSKNHIFGNKKGSEPDPNAMQIDQANKNKGKNKEQANNTNAKRDKYCHICAGKGHKSKAKTHNTSDCYDKPGNENKRPAPKASASTSTAPPAGQGNKGGQQAQGSNRGGFKARLLEFLQELEDDDSPATPAGSVNINTTSISRSVNPKSTETVTTAHVDEVQEGPRPTGQSMVNRRSNLDFPNGM